MAASYYPYPWPTAAIAKTITIVTSVTETSFIATPLATSIASNASIASTASIASLMAASVTSSELSSTFFASLSRKQLDVDPSFLA